MPETARRVEGEDCQPPILRSMGRIQEGSRGIHKERLGSDHRLGSAYRQLSFILSFRWFPSTGANLRHAPEKTSAYSLFLRWIPDQRADESTCTVFKRLDEPQTAGFGIALKHVQSEIGKHVGAPFHRR